MTVREHAVLGLRPFWSRALRRNLRTTDTGSKRDHHGMAYDSARRRVVLFGGWNGAFLGDTWEWDGATWEAGASTGPSPRGGTPSMAYDSGRSRVVLFGGWSATGAVSDVWEWNGREWTRIAPGATAPMHLTPK